MLKERLKQVVKDKIGPTLTRLERRTVQKSRVKDVKRLSKWMSYLPSTGNMLFWFIQIFLIVLIRSIVPYPYSMGILSIVWLSVSIAAPPDNNVSMLRAIPPLNMKSSTTLERWLAALCVYTQIHAVFGGDSSVNQAFGFIWIMCSSHTLQTQEAADTVRRHFWCITCGALFQLLSASFPFPPNLMLSFVLAAGMNWFTHLVRSTRTWLKSEDCIKHFNIWGIVALLPFTLLYLITSTSLSHNWYSVWCVGMLWQLIRLTFFELIVSMEPTSHPMLIRCIPSIVSCLLWWYCDSWLWSAVWLLAFVCMSFQAVLREPIEHVVWPSAERAANLILSQESALAKQNPIFGKLIPQLRTVMEQAKT